MTAPSFEISQPSPAENAESLREVPEEAVHDLGMQSLRLVMDQPSEQDLAKQAAEEKVARLVSSPWAESAETVARRFAEYKITPSDAETLIEQAEVMRPVARVSVRQTLESFAKIVRDGKFKSVFEAGASSAIDPTRNDIGMYQKLRRRFEALQFDQTDDEQSVIYGFLNYSAEGRGDTIDLPAYGNVQFILKPEVAARTTFSEDDSLGEYSTSQKKVEFVGFDDAVVMQQVIEHAKQNTTSAYHYVEGQIHGGLDLNDVESVEVTLKPKDLEQHIEAIELLQTTHPDIKVVVNLDYSGSNFLPVSYVNAHPTIDFRPIVTTDMTMFMREKAQALGNDFALSKHSERVERVNKLRDAVPGAWQRHTGAPVPASFGTPKMMYFMNGDRLSK
jgi:hypothetical protein